MRAPRAWLPPPAAEPPRRPLPRRFFARDTVTVARELVGCTLWTLAGDDLCAGRIVETEAYLDERDPASHAARGPTARSGVMFGPPGVAYVYLIYGVHHCLNVVAEAEGQAGAVLLRALEPLVGLPTMRRRRGGESRVAGDEPRAGDRALCAGPGRLCRALGVDLACNGLLLGARAARRTQPDPPVRVWIAAGRPPARLTAGPRIGISLAASRPLRFCDDCSPCLSRPAPAAPLDRPDRASGSF